MCDALDFALEICKLLKYSRTDTTYETIVQPIGLCVLRIPVNYSALEATWDETLEVCSQSEVKARIIGVQSKMKDFDFLFGLLLGE